MDSYEILNVSKDSNDREIEISYDDLKKKYDPSVNTSIRAYKKYREILRAYEDIKNESRRKMYDLKERVEIDKVEAPLYKLFDYRKIDRQFIEEVVDYDNLEQAEEIEKEDIVVEKKISYLYYLLNLKVDVKYRKMVNCNDCLHFDNCSLCDGEGVVYYREKQIYCPKCHGLGKVSCNCSTCNGEGNYIKDDSISFYVDNDVIELNDYGNEYYDGSKSNLKILLDFYDKENIEVKGNEISVNYYLSKEETKKGILKEYYSDSRAFKLEVNSFVEDGYKKEIFFGNKKILFTFYNESIDGEDTVNYLFINRKYINNYIYFNDDYSECSLEQSNEFMNKFVLKDETFLEGFGKKGMYGGRDGNLTIKCVFTGKNDVEYVKDLEIVETSKLFNILGGKIGDVSHFGLKKENYLLNKKEKHYLLSGNSNKKMKLKEYYLFRIICLALWFIIPFVILLVPYSQTMFIILFGLLFSYLILINILMEVRV